MELFSNRGRLAQLVRAFGSHPRGHRFESCIAQLPFFASLPQIAVSMKIIRPHDTSRELGWRENLKNNPV